MKPLFDAACRHVGWMSHQHVFDCNMNWLAFIRGSDLYSAVNYKWLGPVTSGTCICDQSGHLVVFTGTGEPRAVYRPVTKQGSIHNGHPKRPVKPPKPELPEALPDTQWSTMSFGLWIEG